MLALKRQLGSNYKRAVFAATINWTSFLRRTVTLMTYQLTTGTSIKRLSDGAFIPNDPGNR
jgi:hypothetical protein